MSFSRTLPLFLLWFDLNVHYYEKCHRPVRFLLMCTQNAMNFMSLICLATEFYLRCHTTKDCRTGVVNFPQILIKDCNVQQQLGSDLS